MGNGWLLWKTWAGTSWALGHFLPGAVSPSRQDVPCCVPAESTFPRAIKLRGTTALRPAAGCWHCPLCWVVVAGLAHGLPSPGCCQPSVRHFHLQLHPHSQSLLHAFGVPMINPPHPSHPPSQPCQTLAIHFLEAFLPANARPIQHCHPRRLEVPPKLAGNGGLAVWGEGGGGRPRQSNSLRCGKWRPRNAKWEGKGWRGRETRPKGRRYVQNAADFCDRLPAMAAPLRPTANFG